MAAWLTNLTITYCVCQVTQQRLEYSNKQITMGVSLSSVCRS